MSFLEKLFSRSQESESIHGEMYRLDVVEELLRDAIRAYQGLIDGMAAHIPKAALDAGQEHRKRLKQVRNLLDAKPSKPLIAEVKQRLDKVLDQFGGELDQQLGQQEQEAKQVMAIVAVMAESMAGREKQYNVRFRGIGRKLRVLTTSNDLAEIRRKLEAEVTQLEKYVDEMARDTESALKRVQGELHQVRKPEQAPKNFLEGPPTVEQPSESSPAQRPLVNRREAEQAIDARCRHDKKFCAARFSLDNMAAVVSQFGLPAAAGLLDQAGAIASQRFESSDLVCRWSEHDLLVMTELPLPEVAMRVAELEEVLAGPYANGDREVMLKVRSCVIERIRGERAHDTCGRIDSMLVRAGRR